MYLYTELRSSFSLQALNPFLRKADIDGLVTSAVVTLFVSVRLGQINHCIGCCQTLLGQILLLMKQRLLAGVEAMDGVDATRISSEMVSHALEAVDLDPAAAPSVLRDMVEALEGLDEAVAKKGAWAKANSRAIASVVFHLVRFSAANALKQVEAKTEEEMMELHQYAAARCYLRGTRLQDISTNAATDEGAEEAQQGVTGEGGDEGEEEEEGGEMTSATRRGLVPMLHLVKSTAKSLAGALVASRSYTKGKVQQMQQLLTGGGGAAGGAGGAMAELKGFDPRFLVFEFMSGFMLRKRQYELVTDFVASAKSGKSSVHQMIMGAGKTTVISPLLSLILADGASLIHQVVPKHLLDQTKQVMRTCFSNVIPKRVYTLTFDRSSEQGRDPAAVRHLAAKLRRARAERAIVCTTPEAVKSLFLQYIDLLQSVQAASPALRCPLALQGEGQTKAKDIADELGRNATLADELKRVVEMWGSGENGIALLDEVDLILHPLKSELNFPIGHKVKLFLAPRRWEFPAFMLDAIFFTQTGRLSLPDSRPDNKAMAILRALSHVIKCGVSKLAIQLEPHLVLLNPSFYQETVGGPKEASNGGGGGEGGDVTDDSVDLGPDFEWSMAGVMAEWSLQWLQRENSVRDDYARAAAGQAAAQHKAAKERAAEEAGGEETKDKGGSGEGEEKGSSAGAAAAAGGESKEPSTGDEGEEVAAAPVSNTEMDRYVRAYVLGRYVAPEEGDSSVPANGCKAQSVVGTFCSGESLQLLNLVRDWLTAFLPHCLGKINRVSYGLVHPADIERWTASEGKPVQMSNSRALLAVPFVGKDVPSRAAEFAHPEVLIGLSILAFRYEGVRGADLKLVITKLKKQLLREFGPQAERPSHIQFNEWLESAGSFAPFSKRIGDDEDDGEGGDGGNGGDGVMAVMVVMAARRGRTRRKRRRCTCRVARSGPRWRSSPRSSFSPSACSRPTIRSRWGWRWRR